MIKRRHPGESRDLVPQAVRAPPEIPAFAGMTDKGQAGFTLVEVMISLGLFGLIAAAGLALVTGIINVQGRTDVRLERLSQLQRTMGVIGGDLDQIAHGPVVGGGAQVSFTRAGAGAGGPPLPIRYALVNGSLVRFMGPRPQLLLPGVASARWRFWDGQWTERWPRGPKRAGVWPRAVELEMQVASPGGPAGSLRRMIVLPAQGDPPPPEPEAGPPSNVITP